MLFQEKKYYREQLQSNKGNMKKTWDIIKNIINQNRNNKSYNQFLIKGKITQDPKIIANNFNDFFTNIGPTLA